MGEENKLPYTYFDAQGNEVAVDSQGNESILEFANDEDAAESANETSNTGPSFKSYNAYQRAQERKANREERKAKFNQFGENFAKWWEAYNGVSTPTVADTTETSSQPKAATQDYGNIGEGVTTNGVPTNGIGGADTTNTGVGGTTANDATNTGDKSFMEQRMDIHTSLQRNNAEALKSYNEAVKNGHSAYETLVRNALQKKANIAERKERDARSRALTNALGTLVGAFTAHGMAKKGGHAPIVNAHDSGVDNDFRKSVEQRYALANENENLLLQLAQERKKYEADLAKSAYERDVKNAEAIADIYNKSIDAAEKAQQKAVDRDANIKGQKDIINYKLDTGYFNTPEEKAAQKATEKQDEAFEKEANGIAQKIFSGKKKTSATVTNGRTSTTLSSASFDNYKYMLTDLYKKAITNRGLSAGNVGKWTAVYNNLFVDADYEYLVGDADVDRFIINLLKEGKSAADVITEVKNKYHKAE